MAWILLLFSAVLACVVIALAAPRTVPVRHARRGSSRRRGRHAATPSTRTDADRLGSGSSGTSDQPGDGGRGDVARLSRHMHLLKPFSPTPRRVDDDPFEVLALQCRLTALAEEIQRLERDRSTIARAHHLRASQYAYDALLAEACTLVGLTSEGWEPAIPDEAPGSWVVDEDTRMRKELELCARGWSW